MARFRIEGMDDVVQEMIRMGQLMGPVADEMLLAGAEEMKNAWQNSITLFGHVDTGEMRRKVGYNKKPKSVLESEKLLDIYPLGRDNRGTKNVQKAFFLHYGRSNMSGSHFVSKAETDGEPKANAAMEARWDKFLENGS